MAALRFRRARTAANLAVSAALGVSAISAGSATLALAARDHGQAGERQRGAAAHQPGRPAQSSRVLPSVSVPLSAPAGSEAASGVTGSTPAVAERDSTTHATSLEIQEARGRARAVGGSASKRTRGAHDRGRGRHLAAGEGVEAVTASEGATETVNDVAASSGLASRHRTGGGHGGGHGRGGGGGVRGKHHKPPGEQPAPGGGSSGGAKLVTEVRPATGVATSAQVSVAPTSKTVPLVPQLASAATQPLGGVANRRGANGSRSGPARGGSVATLLGAPTGVAAEAPLAGESTRVRPAASRSASKSHAASNPLEGIGRQIPLPIPVPDWSKPIIALLLVLAVWFAIRASLVGARARRLERQRAGLLRDVGVMQAALVPEVPRRVGGLDVSVAYRPAEGPAAGGDFYDLFIPEPGSVAIMLGDVSGHGHDALTHAALTRYTLRAYLQAGLEPRAALALAGRVLADPTGERYATVAVALYDTGKGTLTYALAGHPPPMLLGLSGHEPVTACSSPPVGWGLPTGRRQTTVSLPLGTEACFFSDGLIEARREGQLLGREHLREILTCLGRGPVAEDLLAEVRAAAQGAPDDMVACVLSPRVAGSDEIVHAEELEVDANTLARPGVRRFLRDCGVSSTEIARALRVAAELAGHSGTALMRVDLCSERAEVSVARASSSADEATATPAPVGEPLLLAHSAAGSESLRARALA
jgi:hypothetical protein